jgi:hypothetical protein
LKLWYDHGEALSQTTTKDDSLYLKFVPHDGTTSATNAVIINAKLFHTFGFYNGHVVVDGIKHEIKDVKGILEDHWALW